MQVAGRGFSANGFRLIAALILCLYAFALVHMVLPGGHHDEGDDCALCMLISSPSLVSVLAILIVPFAARRSATTWSWLAPSDRFELECILRRGPPLCH